MKRILKILFILGTTAFITAGGVLLYFQKNIKPILISEINNALAVKVSVDQFEVSSLIDFPKLGINLTGVKVDESTPHFKQKLVNAEMLGLYLDVWQLYKGKYIIDAIEVRGGTLRFADLNHTTNYNIIKPSPEEQQSSVSFEIKNLQLIDCDIIYEHRPSQTQCKAISTRTKASLKYTPLGLNLNITSEWLNTSLHVNNEPYIVEKTLNINTGLDVNTSKETITIQPSKIAIEKVKLNTNGTIDYSSKPKMDLNFGNDNSDAQSLLSVLPASIKSIFDDILLDGNLEIDGKITGNLYAHHSPKLTLTYGLQNGSVGIIGQPIKLQNVDANGIVSMPSIAKLSTSTATCKIAKAKSENNYINGNILVKNFEIPHISWDGKATLDASFVSNLVDYKHIKITKGKIKVDGTIKIAYNTKTANLIPNSLFYNGKLLCSGIEASLTSPKIDIKDFTLDLSANKTKMAINQLDLTYNNTECKIQGYVENYPSIFDINSNSMLVGNLIVKNLIVNELYSNTNSNLEEDRANNKQIIPVKFRLKTNIQNFKYNDFVAQSIQGNLISDCVSLTMPNCNIQALNGGVTASVHVKKWGKNLLLDINSKLNNINITSLFKQFNNFEQEEITSQHISGRLSGHIQAKVLLDKNYEPILPKLYAKANIDVANGAITNYEPLQELSSFADISDLQNVKFKTLKNTIEIFDEVIYIPKMNIQNNALNLDIEGTQTFENYMKYSIGLSVAELLAKKSNWIARKKEKQLERNSKGRLTAHIKMEGTPDNLKITYDKTRIKQNVKQEVKEEKKKFIQAIKGEQVEADSTETKDYDTIWDE